MGEVDSLLSRPLKEINANVTNTLLCGFLLVGLFFGVLFYDFIDNTLHFSYIDEMLAFSLCLFTLFVIVHDRQVSLKGYWFGFFGVFLFYLAYSFYIHSNIKSAIIQDFIVEIKPFLGFFCGYTIGTELTRNQKKVIRAACFVAIFLLLLTTPNIYFFMGHPSRYATAATFIAMLYLFASDFDKRNLLVFLLLLSVAVFSGKAKAFGFVALAGVFSVLCYKKVRFRFSLKSLVVSLLILLLVVLVSWEKINYYFIYGSQNIAANDVQDAFARPAMYWGAWQILCDYFPFGSGFASFGTFFSTESYSSVYVEYGLNYVHGLSEEMPEFITDAYYPSLAQYGFAGIALFVGFWVFVVKKAMRFRVPNSPESSKLMFLVVVIVCFFSIELVADTTLTHNRGLFMMVLLGLIGANMRNTNLLFRKENEKNTSCLRH